MPLSIPFLSGPMFSAPMMTIEAGAEPEEDLLLAVERLRSVREDIDSILKRVKGAIDGLERRDGNTTDDTGDRRRSADDG